MRRDGHGLIAKHFWNDSARKATRHLRSDEYRKMAGRFCEAIEKRALRVGDLDGAAAERLRHAVLSGVTGSARTYARFCLGRFIDHLIESGAATAPQPPVKKLTPLDRLREEYEAYLRRQRGLAESTIANCAHYMERFLAFRFGAKLGDLNAITPDDIVAFLGKLKAGSRRVDTSRRRPICATCSSFCSGAARPSAISPTACRASPRPPATTCHAILTPKRSSGCIEAVRTNDAVGRRNYAMLLLMARLGLRAPEVIAIQLDDIDWRAGEILIRGKGKLHDRMPLPVDAGEAIVDYIKNGRKGDSRTLFVSGEDAAPALQGCADLKRHAVRRVRRERALSRRRNMSARICCATAWRPTCCAKARRSTRSATSCAIVRACRRPSTPNMTSMALRSIARRWPVGGDAR